VPEGVFISVLQLFKVEFEVVKATAGQTGRNTQYRRGLRSAIFSAASPHPKDILATLTADITIGSGESFEILAVQPLAPVGTEGNVIYS
jgi:hypothetical protein